MLTVNNLYKSYVVDKKKVYANSNISFSVDNGQVVWIYGNSGSGKSTLLNMITGLDKADKGSVLYDNIDILKLSNNEKADFRLRNCGLIFQFFELIKTQNVYNNVALPLKLLGEKDIKNRVRAGLAEYNDEDYIDDLMKKKPNQLSGGEKQRIAIARAIITNPKIIIADEITASLDTEMSNKVYKNLREYIKKENGIGIFVSHDPIIKDYADVIYKMNNGELVREK